MPSVSKKQHNLMALVANDPKAAKRLGISQSVGKEFVSADKGKKFGTGGNVNYTYGGKGQINKQQTRGGSIYGVEKNIPNVNLNKYVGKKEGGIMKHEDIKLDKKMIKKAVGMHDKQLHGGKKTDLEKLKGGGMTRMMAKGEHPVQKQSKRGAEMVKMAKGGVAKTVTKEMEYDYKTGKKSFAGSTAQRDAHAEKEGKRVAKDLAYDKGMKKGGCTKMARGGGIETKGKTKGTMIKMKGC